MKSRWGDKEKSPKPNKLLSPTNKNKKVKYNNENKIKKG